MERYSPINNFNEICNEDCIHILISSLFCDFIYSEGDIATNIGKEYLDKLELEEIKTNIIDDIKYSIIKKKHKYHNKAKKKVLDSSGIKSVWGDSSGIKSVRGGTASSKAVFKEVPRIPKQAENWKNISELNKTLFEDTELINEILADKLRVSEKEDHYKIIRNNIPDDTVYIIFRGTHTGSQWITNIQGFLSNLNTSINNPNLCNSGKNIGIHKRWYEFYNKLLDDINNCQTELFNKNLIISGHSLGGVYANLIGFSNNIIDNAKKTTIITFGCPQFCNQEGANDFNNKMISKNISSYNIINHGDPINCQSITSLGFRKGYCERSAIISLIRNKQDDIIPKHHIYFNALTELTIKNSHNREEIISRINETLKDGIDKEDIKYCVGAIQAHHIINYIFNVLNNLPITLSEKLPVLDKGVETLIDDIARYLSPILSKILK